MADALRSAAPQEHPGRRQGWARRETRAPNLLMRLHLEDVYWTERGRHSVHVVLAEAVARTGRRTTGVNNALWSGS